MATIGMVLENDYPDDLRVEKEASALRHAGHDVHLLALEFGDRHRRERVGPLTVHRVRFPRTLHRKLHPTIVRTPIYGTLWRRWISRFVSDVRPDLLHAHDLPIAGPAVSIARRAGRPSIVDLHEMFPAAIREWGLLGNPLARWLYDADHWERYERDVCRAADGVVVVVDEARAAIARHGVDPTRVTVVSNTDRVDFGHDVTARPVDEDGPVTFLYIGGFGPHRGLDTIVDAATHLPTDGSIRIRLVGDGNTRAEIERRVRERSVGAIVSVHPWVPKAQVAEEIGACHVGLVPHRRSPHTETTIPHKLFLYMAMGRPVLVSDCAPLARVAGDGPVGLVFASGDPADAARAMRELADPARRRSLGSMAAVRVASRYNWERDRTALVDLVGRLVPSSPARRATAPGS